MAKSDTLPELTPSRRYLLQSHALSSALHEQLASHVDSQDADPSCPYPSCLWEVAKSLVNLTGPPYYMKARLREADAPCSCLAVVTLAPPAGMMQSCFDYGGLCV